MSDWLNSVFSRSIPDAPIGSVVTWAEEFVRLPGSARSDRYVSSITPWTRAPIECGDDDVTRTETFVKPVQSGGSVAGEILLCRWISTKNSGDIQYNWEDDKKAHERYEKRIERILRACGPVQARWPALRNKAKRGLVIFPHCSLTVQGVFTADNLDSDSIRFQLNEEIHNWDTGRLEKAYRRTTAFWNSVIVNISNAGVKGDQLFHAFHAGTQEHWEVLCPGCRKPHAMRISWEEKKPKLGGLRYDSSKCKRADGSYDYNKLEKTIRYQMPCGYEVRDTPAERRALSLSGRYGPPRNKGAHIKDRSHTLEAVSVDYIPFLQLIQEKHQALRVLRYGDPEPFKKYMQERECRFWDPEDRPLTGKIVLNSALKLDRDGLEGRAARYFALDRQQGELIKGDLPHWWMVIRDVMPNGDSRLVFEGKIETDEDVIANLDRHKCLRRHGVADTGDDTVHCYKFCLRYGINGIKGGTEAFYSHGEAGKKIFSIEKPLHRMLNIPSTANGGIDEPQFWLYSKPGIRDRLHWLRVGGAVKWEVPGNVSADYQAHMESEELQERRGSRGEVIMDWVQLKRRNDLFVCECYIAMLMDMGGHIGAQIEKEK